MMTETIGRKKYDLDRTVRLVLTCVSVAVGIFLVNYLRSILLPFVVGCLLAYMLEPVVRFFMRVFKMKNRMFPALLTMVLFFGAIVLACWFLLPIVFEDFVEMGKLLGKYIKHEVNEATLPDWMLQFANEHLNAEELESMFSKEQMLDFGKSLMSGTVSVVGSTLHFVMAVASWLIALLYMFFVLLDYDIIARGFKSGVPKAYRHTVFRIFNDVTGTMSRYFRGQALVSLFVGIIFAIEFSIIDLPMAIIFGLSIGVLNFVPYLQLISIPFAAFLCIVQSVATGQPLWPLFGWTIAAYCICQVIQDLVLIPSIMRSQMGLRPAIVFLALALWSYVLGFIGLIVALPLTSLLISYYNEFILHVPKFPSGKQKPKIDEAKVEAIIEKKVEARLEERVGEIIEEKLDDLKSSTKSNQE
ncbi:MAG: AI-2E family transporter [Bacteroidales bacterium]|nr:AI-2E family transporter [Bacteroidales bacterium]